MHGVRQAGVDEGIALQVRRSERMGGSTSTIQVSGGLHTGAKPVRLWVLLRTDGARPCTLSSMSSDSRPAGDMVFDSIVMSFRNRQLLARHFQVSAVS